MPIYKAPLRDQQFVIHEVLGAVDVLRAMPRYADIDADTVNQVLEEAGKFTEEVLQPTNLPGDREGCQFDPQTHVVKTPAGFREAWDQYREAGWQGLTADAQHGGQGLPVLLHIAFDEMRCAANQAWTMYGGLTLGAYECLRVHASPALQATYLPKLANGEWTGTMCLTESHCGTDLGMLRTRAEPEADGSYRITGNKIFISAGEHDMAENIVHLVLARLPGAPAGTRGISLFVVPKFLPVGEGAGAGVGARNGVHCAGIEHKMGIHGNATCQLVFEDARGWLVGEANKGLPAMFVMMNAARLGVAVQGLGQNEVALQNAAAYARDRIQGRALSGAKAPEAAADPILVHSDVRRILLTARAYAEGARAFVLWTALMADRQNHDPDEAQRKLGADMMALVTPIAKAFLTDNGFLRASECLQVYGGHGYIHEHGMEQFVRDARINMIYEGTNAVQSLDLLGRKVLGDGGAKFKVFGAMVQEFLSANGTNQDMSEFVTPLADLGDKVQKLSMEIGMKALANPEEAGAASVDYLRVVGHLVFAYFWARMARVALDRIAADGDKVDPFYRRKLATARFYFTRLLPETAYHIRAARAGAQVLTSYENDWF